MDSHASALSSAVDLSPYHVFSRERWANLRADAPLTLNASDLKKLQSLNDPVSLDDVIEIYLPLSRLLSLYVAATQGLYKATQRFLMDDDGKVPYIIAVAGSVSAGKSTTARILQAMLSRWPNTPKVELVTTDGFLMPNAELARQGLMERKGFPESYDAGAILKFLARVKAGEHHVEAPLYSHLVYDVLPDEKTIIDRPDILIFEGINVLQGPGKLRHGQPIPFVSDFFDFTVYIDADEIDLHRWYVQRFMKLRDTAFRDPKSYFRKYADLPEEEATAIANGLWERINLVNLRENIVPTRPRASLIMRKGPDHRIEEVALRKL